MVGNSTASWTPLLQAVREWPHLRLAGEVRDLGKQRTSAVQDHQRIPRRRLGLPAAAWLPGRLPGAAGAWVACGSPAQSAMTRSGSGCSLSPRVTAVIAGLLAGRGACCLSASEMMARATATAAYRLGALTVATPMMVPAVCADDASGPASCRLAGCHRVRLPGPETDRSRARPGPQNAVDDHGVS